MSATPPAAAPLAKKSPAAAIIEAFKEGPTRDKLMSVAARGFDVEKMVPQVALAISRNPQLAECTQQSIINCMFLAAELGLSPTGSSTLGHAYMVPYYDGRLKAKVAQLIVGYRGYIVLARRSGLITKVSAYAVHKDEHFVVHAGTEERIDHKPNHTLDHSNPDNIVACYATFTYKDGTKQFTVMSKAELARRAGLSTLTIDRVERGMTCRMDTKRKILEALGLTPSDRVTVFGDDD